MYKLKAEELRTIAQMDCEEEVSAAFLRLADDYDFMARLIEHHDNIRSTGLGNGPAKTLTAFRWSHN